MQEWYLMNGTNESVSGYEDDVFSDYNDESFSEILGTHVAKTIVLYNHDLSEHRKIRAVIQGNVADTQLKTLERTILCEIGVLKAGMYVEYDDAYWLVTGRPSNNGFYEKSTLLLCNWLLKWQNKFGEIISRWAVVESASKYNDGEDGNSTLTFGSDQFSVMIPIDNESISIPREIKFFIDYNYEDSTVYQLTNPSNVLYRYGDNNGVTHWIVKEVPYSPNEKDLLYEVCDYKEFDSNPNGATSSEETVMCNIVGRTELMLNKIRSYIVNFTDENGLSLSDIDFTWNINCSFESAIEKTIDGVKIDLSCSDASLCEEAFLLEIIVDGSVLKSKQITIVEGY